MKLLSVECHRTWLISQHWFRWWLGADRSMSPYVVCRPQWVESLAVNYFHVLFCFGVVMLAVLVWSSVPFADIRNEHETINVTSQWARWRLKRPTGVSIICSTVCSDADQRKQQSSVSLVFVGVIPGGRWIPLTKGPVTRKMFPFDDVIMF